MRTPKCAEICIRKQLIAPNYLKKTKQNKTKTKTKSKNFWTLKDEWIFSSMSPLDSSCAEILLEELDRMEEPNGETEEPAEHRKSTNDAQWTVLNVDFGIPLFDSLLNQQVCDRIINQRIWRKETLDSLKTTQNSMTTQLMQFISNHVESSTDGKVACSEVALPTKNLLFSDGVLSVWNGKWNVASVGPVIGTFHFFPPFYVFTTLLLSANRTLWFHSEVSILNAVTGLFQVVEDGKIIRRCIFLCFFHLLQDYLNRTVYYWIQLKHLLYLYLQYNFCFTESIYVWFFRICIECIVMKAIKAELVQWISIDQLSFWLSFSDCVVKTNDKSSHKLQLKFTTPPPFVCCCISLKRLKSFFFFFGKFHLDTWDLSILMGFTFNSFLLVLSTISISIT